MYVNDFEFDGKLLSSFGFSCMTWNGDPNASSNVSNIEFTTTRPINRSKWGHYSSQFSEPLSTTIEIGKYNCDTGTFDELTPDLQSPVMRWLNRRDGYKEFRLPDQTGYNNLYFYVQINATPLMFGGRVYGFELAVTANRPFAIKKCTNSFTISEANGQHAINDISDDIGNTPVTMIVTATDAGTLTIKNSRLDDSEAIVIENVVADEKFILDGVNLIATDVADRSDITMANRFNFKFPTLVNTYADTANVFTFSVPCTVEVQWDSPVKVGF